ncbi:hypothetical protein PHYSODRAFT_328347 [Phytophthora sojae]|uniref:RxLR effector protein n=1 Tax=Phytophthora sojae (strain P6497) TaxID=1094619 RepID=G4Z565_PHYSP|nr:hypothetical protein PHYSODRAFT_328347 [Phytophthora sojae]EGZ20208.1 hypothetical protein PHYSODRAFT_328347 [Phytophthora sojae]|eukprot:XP_009522925.1 hypothetical protein PHYSODRAFT_328347 [Phytophthora sojae]
MQLAHFLLLLLLITVARSDGTDGQTNALYAEPHRSPMKNGMKDGNPSTGEEDKEERGLFSSASAKIESNSPVMKKREATVKNDPRFFTKLNNNPESVN